MTPPKWPTIGQQLLNRLQELGVKHIFGVPGDYVLRFDKLIEEGSIQFINATRENTAGYMADAYARLRGLGVACITYGVGINIVNSVSQAYVESSPLVLISGAASTEDYLRCPQLHHLFHKSYAHSDTTQLEIFKHVTVAQTVLDNPNHAAEEIDRVLNLCLQKQKPVYIELPRNFVDMPISGHKYSPQPKLKEDAEALKEALAETAAILNKSKQPIIWAGHELLRFGLSDALLQFAEKYRIPIVSSLLGKTVINERHPLFIGVYQGGISRKEVLDYFNSCDCVMVLGVVLSDVDTGIFSAKLHEQNIIATADGIKIRHHHFQAVSLPEYIKNLSSLSLKGHYNSQFPAAIDREIPAFVPASHKPLSTARLFECIQHHLSSDNIIVADFGDSLFGSSDFLLEQNSFLASAYFGTLGFGTPGAIGAQMALPKRRVIGIIGDGAFQMTSMELSTAVRFHSDPIIIVLNNQGYGTERPLLEGKYNDITNWNYAEIPRMLGGGIGIKAKTEEEVDKALKMALSKRGTFYLIEVELDKTDYSPAMRRFLDLASKGLKK